MSGLAIRERDVFFTDAAATVHKVLWEETDVKAIKVARYVFAGCFAAASIALAAYPISVILATPLSSYAIWQTVGVAAFFLCFASRGVMTGFDKIFFHGRPIDVEELANIDLDQNMVRSDGDDFFVVSRTNRFAAYFRKTSSEEEIQKILYALLRNICSGLADNRDWSKVMIFLSNIVQRYNVDSFIISNILTSFLTSKKVQIPAVAIILANPFLKSNILDNNLSTCMYQLIDKQQWDLVEMILEQEDLRSKISLDYGLVTYILKQSLEANISIARTMIRYFSLTGVSHFNLEFANL
jgi:hypothetical protein